MPNRSCVEASVLAQINAAMNQSSINWNQISTALKKSWWGRQKFNLLSSKETCILSILQVINPKFKQLERKGIKHFKFNDSAEAIKYRERFKVYFDLTASLERQVATLKGTSAQFKRAYYELKLNVISLQYSLGQANGGLDKLQEANSPYFNLLKVKALDWKKKQSLAVHKELNDLELQQLAEAAKYPKWCQLCLEYSNCQTEFFNWALKDYNPVNVFIECRHTQKEIKGALLSPNLGYVQHPKEEPLLAFRNVALRLDVEKRELTLPILHIRKGDFSQFQTAAQERVNILKPEKQSVTFKESHHTVTMKDILSDQAKKNQREPNFILTPRGFVDFHPVLGYWDAKQNKHVMPKLTEQNWIHRVPPARIVYDQDLRQYYGQEIEGKTAFIKVKATRTVADKGPYLYALNCHGFWGIYISMGGGKWKVLDIGIYANRFQNTLWQGLSLFGNTVPRVFTFLDQNGYYTHRQRAAYPLLLEKEVTQNYLNRIYKTFSKLGVFQFTANNCTRPVQKVTEKTGAEKLNFFRMPFTKARSGLKPLDFWLALLDKCPQTIRYWGIYLVQKLLFASRGLEIEYQGRKKWYSVASHLKAKAQGNMYHPAYLHYQIEQAHKNKSGPFVKGELSWGNTDNKLI